MNLWFPGYVIFLNENILNFDTNGNTKCVISIIFLNWYVRKSL